MSIMKSVFIYGCGQGSVGAAIAGALAGKAVHVFACAPFRTEMPQLDNITNITLLGIGPVPSLAAFHIMKERIAARLGGGKLNIVINAGLVGHQEHQITGDDDERREKLWTNHISAVKNLDSAFRLLLIESHGLIIHLTSHSMLNLEMAIKYLPNPPESMQSHLLKLYNELQPLGVKLLTIGHERERADEYMISDGLGQWLNVAALARDIMEELFRLPGQERVL